MHRASLVLMGSSGAMQCLHALNERVGVRDVDCFVFHCRCVPDFLVNSLHMLCVNLCGDLPVSLSQLAPLVGKNVLGPVWR